LGAELQYFVEESGELIAALGCLAVAGSFTEVVFEFPSQTLSLSCNDDTDEIEVSTAKREPPTSLVAIDELADLIGTRVEYAWQLTNHRGYDDAFQLRFIDSGRNETTLQFEVMASTMILSRVAP
jgi:hypothetical protein